MSIERAIIAQARPHVLATKARALLYDEITKGCRPDISPYPIALAPPYRAIADIRDFPVLSAEGALPSTATINAADIIRLQVWLAPDHMLDWNRSELFLKQLQRIRHRAVLEITGNANEITLALVCHKQDVPVVVAAFRGEFVANGLTQCEVPLLPANSGEEVAFMDLFPPPPYSHLLTRPDEVHYSPYESMLAVLAHIPPPAIGLYQAVFQPVPPEQDYHRNVEVLQDIEFAEKLLCGFQLPQRAPQQTPSGDLRQMAGVIQTKAHTDKPFFFLAMRVTVLGAGQNALELLNALATFASLFQHGGRPLNCLGDAAYRSVLNTSEIRDMFLLGQVYRPGFLVNSWELTGPVHFPPGSLIQQHLLPIQLTAGVSFDAMRVATGIQIGICNRAGTDVPVCIAPEFRRQHIHIVGAPDMGKSSLMEYMVLQDILNGNGVAVIDPHGDLVDHLLYLIPEKDIPRVTYFNPGDPGWVTLWNPLVRDSNQDAGRTADGLVRAFRSIVTGWGDRLEHLLRQSLYAVLHLSDSTMLDVVNLLRSNSEESARLRRAFLPLLTNVIARDFWTQDFKHYSKEAISPVHHKWSKLMMSEAMFLMLSQPENRFNFRKIMDDRGILLINLAHIGPDEADVLGGFILGLFYLTALGRSATPIANRTPYYMYCDEAHRFATDGMEELLVELRKFGLGVTLSHHYTKQFTEAQADALSETGTTIIFRVDGRDAHFLAKDLLGKVKPEILTTLRKGETIARIDSEVIQVHTLKPLSVPEKNFRDRIISESQKLYCMPVDEVRARIGCRRVSVPIVFPELVSGDEEKVLSYDEF